MSSNRRVRRARCPDCHTRSRDVRAITQDRVVYQCASRECNALFYLFSDGRTELAKTLDRVAPQDDMVERMSRLHQSDLRFNLERGRVHQGPSGYRPASGKVDKDMEFSQSKSGDLVFTVETSDVEEGQCAHRRYSPPALYFPVSMWNNFVLLAGKVNTEWIALLKAEADAQGDYQVRGFYFPPQVATGGHVDVDDDHTPEPGVTGALHSHVNMAAFWSGEDDKHWNWPFEVVLNARGEYSARIRHQMACGCWSRAKTKVFTVGDMPELVTLKTAFDKGKEAREAKAKSGSGYQPTAVDVEAGDYDWGHGQQTPLFGQDAATSSGYTPQGPDDGSAAIEVDTGQVGGDDWVPAEDIEFLRQQFADEEVWMCDRCGELYAKKTVPVPTRCGDCHGTAFTLTTYGDLLRLAREEESKPAQVQV